MELDAVKNFSKVTVSTGYDSTDVIIDLEAGYGDLLPDPSVKEFNVVWWDSTTYEDPADDPRKEIVRVTGKSSDRLTVTRAQEGTLASTKNTSNKTYKMILGITAKMIEDIESSIGNEINNETPSGLINGTNKEFALANTPSPSSSLKLFLGGMYMTVGEDYSIDGDTITFINSPYSGPIRAFYKY